MWRRFLLLMSVALALTGVVPSGQAVIVLGSGDPAFNDYWLNPPSGPLANSGGQYEVIFHDFLGTTISPNFFLTAHHIGGNPGRHLHLSRRELHGDGDVFGSRRTPICKSGKPVGLSQSLRRSISARATRSASNWLPSVAAPSGARTVTMGGRARWDGSWGCPTMSCAGAPIR